MLRYLYETSEVFQDFRIEKLGKIIYKVRCKWGNKTRTTALGLEVENATALL
jgi:hypothetical protein